VHWLVFTGVGILGYLVGSIPTGYLVARSRGVDIRAVGSGNIGATNVMRQLGRTAGLSVFLVDALKGWIAAALLPMLICLWSTAAAQGQAFEWLRILGGVCAILGHNYTCWLNFKGGKGVATSAGVLIALVPIALLMALAIWLAVVFVSRYVSLASISAAASLPVASWLAGYGSTYVIITGALGALTIYKHKSNIQRLLNGTESRFTPKSRRQDANQSDQAK